MSSEQYFTQKPSATAKPAKVAVEIAGQTYDLVTDAGVFSGSRLDPGTRVLLRKMTDPSPSGDLLDIGCGWGPIALTMAKLSPDATVWAVDINERARELCTQNAGLVRADNVKVVPPQDVPAELRFAEIWSNPPIRIGKQALHELLGFWLPRLRPDGVAYLVVQRHLGADSLAKWITANLALSCEKLASAKGYRVLEVRHQ